jgi:hypothetical protein
MTSPVPFVRLFLRARQVFEKPCFFEKPRPALENKVVRPLQTHMDTKARRANHARQPYSIRDLIKTTQGP